MSRKKIERLKAIVILFAFEMIISIAVAAIAGSIIIPAVEESRGYHAIGGEWLLVMVIAMATYSALHGYIFKSAAKMRRKRGKNATRKVTRRSRSVSGGNYSRVLMAGCERESGAQAGENYSA